MTDGLTKQDLLDALALTKQELFEAMDEGFAEQKTWLKGQFQSERMYYQQLIEQELKGIKDALARLEERSNNDAVDNLKELESFKKRVIILEKAVAQLQAV